jgi:hypothetical protein
MRAGFSKLGAGHREKPIAHRVVDPRMRRSSTAITVFASGRRREGRKMSLGKTREATAIGMTDRTLERHDRVADR